MKKIILLLGVFALTLSCVQEIVVPNPANYPLPVDFSYDGENSSASSISLVWDAETAINAGAIGFTVQLLSSRDEDPTVKAEQLLDVTYPILQGRCTFNNLSQYERFCPRIRVEYERYTTEWKYLEDEACVEVGVGLVDGLCPVSKPVVRLNGKSAGTLTFSWSGTGFKECKVDFKQDWNIALYSDEECKNIVVSWDIPAKSNLYVGRPSNDVYELRPCGFIFTGLEPQTPYWFVATNISNPTEPSEPFMATTDPSLVVIPGEEKAEVGDVILYEDFDELVWGGDLLHDGVGYSSQIRSSATEFGKAQGVNPVGGDYSLYLINETVTIGLFTTMGKIVPTTRLSSWGTLAEDGVTPWVQSLAGSLQLGGSNCTSSIVTPQLNCLEWPATLEVGFDAVMLNIREPRTGVISLVSDGVVTTPNSVVVGTVLAAKEFEIEAGYEVKHYSYLVPNVAPDDRIAVGSRRPSSWGGAAWTGQCRILMDNISLKVVGYNKPESITDAASLQAFLSDERNSDAGTALVGVVENDIDLTGFDLVPPAKFFGSLDFASHKLLNWTNNRKPLICNLSGKVTNLVIDESCTLTAGAVFGAVADTLSAVGVISGCRNNAAIIADIPATNLDVQFGAMVAFAQGPVIGCHNAGDITLSCSLGTLSKPIQAGQLIGKTEFGAENCSASGSFTITAAVNHWVYVGGIIGVNTGASSKFTDLTFSGKIYANGTATRLMVGGIIASQRAASGYYDNCSTTADALVSSAATAVTEHLYLGGLIGDFSASATGTKLINSVNNAKVHSSASCTGNYRHNVGGLVGYNVTPSLAVENSTNNGLVHYEGTTYDANVGGLLAYNNQATISFKGSVNNGEVLSGGSARRSARAAGIIAWQESGQCAVENVANHGAVNMSTVAVTQDVGGIVGYAPAKTYANCLSDGPVTILTEATTDGYAGGLAGRTNVNITMKSCTIKTVVSGGTSKTTYGIIAGKHNNSTSTVTVGVSGSPFIIKAGTEINSTVITSENYKSYLYGNTNGSTIKDDYAIYEN